MEPTSPTVFRERLFAGMLLFLGLSSLAYSVPITEPREIQFEKLAPTVLFAGAIVLADHFPIHLIRGTKASLGNMRIYLSAVLLLAPLAIGATGAGLLIADLVARSERGLLPRDMFATAGQQMFTAFCGYQIIHTSMPGILEAASKYELLVLCAATFLSIYVLVFSLSQSVLLGEAFLATLKMVVREGMVLELLQYLIAILGTLAAFHDRRALMLLIVPLAITYVAFKNHKETRRETVQILEDMADTADLRDIYTGGHSKRVARLVRKILIELKTSRPEATLIELAARLHDNRKIGIPDSILVKRDTLVVDEMAHLQTHWQKGADLISKYRDCARGAMIIKHRHGRWDGSGYPTGLKGSEIPFGARVIAVADSFDAMASDRPYRTAISRERAIQISLEGRESRWDASIVNAFVDMIDKVAESLMEQHRFNCSDPTMSREFWPALPASLL